MSVDNVKVGSLYKKANVSREELSAASPKTRKEPVSIVTRDSTWKAEPVSKGSKTAWITQLLEQPKSATNVPQATASLTTPVFQTQFWAAKPRLQKALVNSAMTHSSSLETIAMSPTVKATTISDVLLVIVDSLLPGKENAPRCPMAASEPAEASALTA